MRAYKCDACGEFYQEYKSRYIVKSNYGFNKTFDLCQECDNKILDIFENNPEIKVQKIVAKELKEKKGDKKNAKKSKKDISDRPIPC
ncbi:MAG: hypothetical protein J6S67_07695 [Methanobrevibacter sp.]|nr:hypothetical protein [Methanobrevibacter sp.]